MEAARRWWWWWLSLLVSTAAAVVATGLRFFPFLIWGPLLGAAVLAYWLRRTEPHRITRAAEPARRPEVGHWYP